MRILGLDVGTKTIGVAVSDPLGYTAQGLTTLRRGNPQADLAAVCAYVEEYTAEEVVVGLPLNMNGSRGPAAELTQKFAESLTQALAEQGKNSVKITLRDERLSTVAAGRALLEADLSRARRKQVIDKMAAVFILQGYLDYLISRH